MADLHAGALDQASGLRRLFDKRPTAVVAVASALRSGARLGGVASDQTRLIMDFVDDFVRVGQNVAILDEHPAPAGVAHAYGVQSRRDFKHVLHGDYLLDDVLQVPSPGIGVIPAARAAGMEFSVADDAALAGNLKLLKNQNDCVMVDCVHRSRQVLSPIARSAERLLVLISPANDDLTSSYALIKRMVMENVSLPMSIVVVRAEGARLAKATFEKLRHVAWQHLGVRLQYLGAAFTPGAAGVSLLPTENNFTPAGVADLAMRDSVLPASMAADSVV